MRRSITALIPVMAALLLASGECEAGGPRVEAYEGWYGVYAGPYLVGYAWNKLAKSSFEGRPAYREDTIVSVRVSLNGRRARIKDVDASYYSESLAPVFEMVQSAEETYLSGKPKKHAKTTEIRYRTGRAVVRATEHGKTRETVVAIPRGTDLTRTKRYELGLIQTLPGERAKCSYVNDTALAVKEYALTGLRRERIRVLGKDYDALVLKVEPGDGSSPTTHWVVPRMCDLMIEMPGAGLKLKLTTKADALAHSEEDAEIPDRIECGKEIPDPGKVVRFGVRLSGAEEWHLNPVSDLRQTAMTLPNGRGVEYRVSTRDFSAAKSFALPIARPETRRWLADSKGVQATDKGIREAARRIVGDERNAYAAACRLRAWVYGNMRFSTVDDTPQSAVEVLKTRTGVCRHSAVLFAALARAAGIPTRTVVGLVYDDRALYGHEWDECFVGEWVAFDPSRSTDSVDATHIKLAVEGADDVVPPIGCKGEVLLIGRDDSGVAMDPRTDIIRTVCRHNTNLHMPVVRNSSCRLHSEGSSGSNRSVWPDGSIHYSTSDFTVSQPSRAGPAPTH